MQLSISEGDGMRTRNVLAQRVPERPIPLISRGESSGGGPVADKPFFPSFTTWMEDVREGYSWITGESDKENIYTFWEIFFHYCETFFLIIPKRYGHHMNRNFSSMILTI